MITHTQFFAALEAAGLVDDATAVSRVVIDAKRGQYVIFHVEQLGDEKVLAVARTLHGPLIPEADPGLGGQGGSHAGPVLASVTDLNSDDRNLREHNEGLDRSPLADIVPDRCRTVSCGAEIFFAVTERGKQMPVDFASAGQPSGLSTLAIRRDEGRLRCRVVKPGEDLQPGEALGVSHYVTCTRPDVHRHRRRGVD